MDSSSIKIEFQYPLQVEPDQMNNNRMGLLKENGYDIKNVINIDNDETKFNFSNYESNNKKIKCFCEEEFFSILDLIAHLKTCRQGREIKWNPFPKWTTESFEPFPTDDNSPMKVRSVSSSASEALDLSKKSPLPIHEICETSIKVQGLLDMKPDAIKWHCPECKFICSNKILLLEHFDCEHKESGSFSCTCGHINDWLPSFLRHYIVCKVAATDLQEEHKDDSLCQSEPNFHNFDTDLINKISSTHSNISKLYNNRWDLSFGLLSGLSHQFLSGWLEPCIKDLPMSFQNKCSWCQRTFSNVSEATNHMNQCNIKPLLKTFDKPFGIDFLKSNHLPFSHSSIPMSPFSERHLTTSNSTINGPPPETSRHFKCSHCIKSFKSKALLDQHMHIHYPPKYTCKYCGKKYRWPPVFYHHQRTCKKRPAALISSTATSTGVCLASLSTASTAITTSSTSYLGNTANLSNSMHTQVSLPHPQNKVSPPNLLMNGSNPFMQHPLINFPTKPSFQPLYPGGNGFSCICGQRIDNFPAYLTHINYCPIFIHMSSKQCSENSPVHLNNSPINPLSFKSMNTGLEHSNPFLHPNGLMLRPPIQSPYFNPGFHQATSKPKVSPPISNQSTSISSNFLQSTDPILVAFASPINSQKPPAFLSDAFPMNLNSNCSTSNSNSSPNSCFNNNNVAKSSLLPPINNFDRLLSHEIARLPIQNSPPFNPSLHSHHHYFGIGKSCNQCGKEFSSRLSLKQHIEGKHSTEGKYQCPSCSKRYRWGASYYYHKKSCIASKDSTSSPNPSPTMTEMIFD